MASENGDSIKLYRSAAQPTQIGTPAKLPPSGLMLIKETELENYYNAITYYKGLIYVGHGIFGGEIDRINEQGQVAKGFIMHGNAVKSLEAHGNRLYCLSATSRAFADCTISVHGLDDGRLLTSWKHPSHGYSGQRMSLIRNDQIAVGDWTGKQIIIYSLTGDVIRRVPLPHCLTMKMHVRMSSCGDDSVVMSEYAAGKVVRISLKDGSLIWSSDSVTNPYGLVHHPAGYILVSSDCRDQVVIGVLDATDGIVY